MNWLKQNTAATVPVGAFVDDADAKTFENALTIQKADVKLSKGGGAYAAASADQGASDAGAPYMANGDYGISLDATDTGTLGRLKVSISKAGALPVWAEFTVLPANVYDSLVGGTDNLGVDLKTIDGTTAAYVVLGDSAFLRVKLSALNGADAGDQQQRAANLAEFFSPASVADWAALAEFIGAIKAKTDNLPTEPAAVGSAMTLTGTERTAVADEVEAQIIDDTDSEKVLQAITDKIASVNPSLSGLTLSAIAAAVRDVLVAGAAANSLGAFLSAIKTKTDALPAAPAATGDIPTAAAIRTEINANGNHVKVGTAYTHTNNTTAATANVTIS